MTYWEDAPSASAARLVARFSGSLDRETPLGPVRVLPDGGVDLLFSFAPGGGKCEAEVFGVKSRALLVHDRQPLEKIAVHLRPGAFARLFRIPAWELRDRVVRLEDLWPGGAALCERVTEAVAWSDRKRLLEAAVSAMWTPDEAPTPCGVLDQAVARILSKRGRISIRVLGGELDVSTRSLERGFREHVGLPPKVFARIVRFRAARWDLKSGRRGAEAAAEAGYSDQAHMIREIRALAGASPTRL